MHSRLAIMIYALAFGVLSLRFPVTAIGAEIFVSGSAVHIVGLIETGDDERFRTAVSRAIQEHPGEPVQSLRIYSSGGNLDAALKIGDQVYALQLETWAPEKFPNGRWKCEIVKTVISFDPKTQGGDSRCVCASACFFIWAAGAVREGEILGVHRPSFNANEFASLSPSDARLRYDALLKNTKASLQKWGIPEDIVDAVFSINSASISFLNQSENVCTVLQPSMNKLLRSAATCYPENS
ncbi:MAG: hypothetical protein C5B53_03130 [Candidatus Melainabacteria bacterium]|nr:MAG: hypothetical protein C5B53_03130 [Candidatus Melainabacteria bacterium]